MPKDHFGLVSPMAQKQSLSGEQSLSEGWMFRLMPEWNKHLKAVRNKSERGFSEAQPVFPTSSD